jgi:hypothetical protein
VSWENQKIKIVVPHKPINTLVGAAITWDGHRLEAGFSLIMFIPPENLPIRLRRTGIEARAGRKIRGQIMMQSVVTLPPGYDDTVPLA